MDQGRERKEGELEERKRRESAWVMGGREGGESRERENGTGSKRRSDPPMTRTKEEE